MTSDGNARRACTVLKVGRGQPARPMVAKRALYNYWAILMPHFRGVLLPPQNRSDESIQWTWTESAAGDAVSAAELATIRKRLSGAQQSLADSLEDAAGLADKAATIRATMNRMQEVVSALMALPDAALAGFVARTERGMLLHSWGLSNPLPVQYLDADFELGGRVLVAGAPASGQAVRLETCDGMSVAQTRTDPDGRFEFTKVVAGSYRVRAVSRPPEVLFSEKGEAVELVGVSITTLEIRNEETVRNVGPVMDGAPSGRRSRFIVIAVAAILVAAVWYFWSGKVATKNALVAGDRSKWDVNVAPRSVGVQRAGESDETKGRSAQAALGAKAIVRPATKPPDAVKPRPEERLEQESSRDRDIVAAQQASGPPTQQTGAPAGSGGITGGATASAESAGAIGAQAGGHSASSSAPADASGAASPGASDASTSGGPTAASAGSSPQVISPAAPANMPPPTGEPQGSPAPRDVAPHASDSERQRAPASSTGTEAPAKEEFVAVKATTANTPDKAVDAAETKSNAPYSTARAPVSDLPDPDAPMRKEIDEGDERTKHDAPMNEGDAVQSDGDIQEGRMVVQMGAASSDPESAPVLRMTFRPAPWRRLLLRDAIVPTLPMRTGRDDAISELSSRVLAEKQAALPRTLQDSPIVVGVRIEFSAASSASTPRWEVASGSAPQLATVEENAAEIGWRDGASFGHYILAAADGQVIASVSTDPKDGVRVSSSGIVLSWPWVGIECVPGESGRLDWQVLGSATVPAAWTKNNRWMNDRGRRLDLRLSAEVDETVVLTLAIVDASTGWAFASKVEQQQKSRR